jgi:hypothetical protein
MLNKSFKTEMATHSTYLLSKCYKKRFRVLPSTLKKPLKARNSWFPRHLSVC